MAHPRPELLAPAGSFEAACAGLEYGADALYIGLPRFSARADATHVDPAALATVVTHAHRLQPRRAVYVTLNTLLLDAELEDALATLEAIEAAGADGVIVQDLAVCHLVRRLFPHLRLHASTQLAVHNLEGARALADLGFRRVVLARELSLEEIRLIAAAAPIEVEVFVHGALCYGYSGLCLFSSMTTGRSGNRGRCAYCCRERFGDSDGGGHLFSMRDLALLSEVPRLQESGVASLKIEGRMKSPLYVAAVTALYRAKLDGTLTEQQEAERIGDIQSVFSRPWTHFHLHGHQPPDHVIDTRLVGHRGTPIGSVLSVERTGSRTHLRFRTRRALEKHDGLQLELGSDRPYGFAVERLQMVGTQRPAVEVPAGAMVDVDLPPDAPDVPAGTTVCCSSSQAVKRRYAVHLPRPSDCRPGRPVAMRLSLLPHGATLSADAAGALHVEAAAAEPLSPARQPEQTAPAARRALERLGETDWMLSSFDLDDPCRLFIPPPLLNALRRELVSRLDAAAAAAAARRHAERLAAIPPTPAPAGRTPTPFWSVKLNAAAEPRPFDGADDVVLTWGSQVQARTSAIWQRWKQAVGPSRLRVALPLIVRGDEQAHLETALRQLADAGALRWEVCDLAGWHLLSRMGAGMEVSADWSLYGLNRLSRTVLAKLGIEAVVASPEETEGNLTRIAAQARPATWVLACQHPPLFISETQPGDGDLRSGTTVQDRRGQRFLCTRIDGRWVTTSHQPYSLLPFAAELLASGVAGFRADFSWSQLTAAETDRLWAGLRRGEAPPHSHCGNYRRGLP